MRRWWLLAVFVFALSVRLVYNVYIAQHRLIDVGDSYYYLNAGRSLAALIAGSPSPQAFIAALCTASQNAPGSFASFSSLILSDRLLIDGPVYPSYLAAVFVLSGKALSTGALNVHQLTFGLANSVVDSALATLVALLGSLAFGPGAGILAGLIWSLYMPAVVDTQQCYGEPVVALLFTALLVMILHEAKKSISGVRASYTSSLGMGILFGLVMLAKPAFVLLPFFLFLCALAALKFGKLYRRFPGNVFGIVCGLIVSLAPWLTYTATISGAPRLMVNRAPGYNLYIGNYLPTDGWKTWPVQEGVPDAVSDAKNFIAGEFKAHPGEMVSLTLRKVARLWAGVWNDFHLAAFGVTYYGQNIEQAVLLLLSVLGLAIFCGGPVFGRRRFDFVGAYTLAWAASFHFIYVLFEPVPRYAFTAMPMVVVLAAAGVASLVKALPAVPSFVSGARRLRSLWQYFLLVAVFALGAACLYKFCTPRPLFLGQISDPASLRAWSAAIYVLAFVLFGLGFARLLKKLGRGGPLAYYVLGKSFVVAALVACAGALSDPAFVEYADTIKGADSTEQNITVPPLADKLAAIVYLLVDAQATSGSPRLSISVSHDGGKTSTPPLPVAALPFYELTAAAADIPTIISLQSRMMDQDPRTFRQWWALPVPAKLVEGGADNRFTISARDGSEVKLFVDYNDKVMPSPTSFSWSKGFLTADCRDPRVYEAVELGGSRKSPIFKSGNLRLIIAVPEPGAGFEQPTLTHSVTLFKQGDAETVLSGADPFSLVTYSAMTPLGGALPPGSVLCLRGKMRTSNPALPATMSLSFETDKSKTPCVPIWQPACLRPTGQYTDFELWATMPAQTTSAQALKATLMLSPYAADRFYLHQKAALKDKLFVKNLTLEVKPGMLNGFKPGGKFKLL